MKRTAKRLTLNRQTVRALTAFEHAAVNGGFICDLSGSCDYSKPKTACVGSCLDCAVKP